MTYPRAHLVDEENGGHYNVTSRCVRRAWLCGIDESGRDFNHRKQWIEDRILQLAEIFTVSILGYAVMSNHYHIVLKTDPQAAQQLSDDEVIERWLQLCPLKAAVERNSNAKAAYIEALRQDSDVMETRRAHLGSLSWFMRFTNEYLARLANKEDQCTGRFWQGRFESKALLDEGAILSAMVYVDLNPVRAGIANTPKECQHTSIKRRIERTEPQAPIRPLSGPDDSVLTLNLDEYLDLMVSTAQLQSGTRRGLAVSNIKLLSRYGLTEEIWSDYFRQHAGWQRALGSLERLKNYASKLGLKHIRFRAKRIVAELPPPMPLQPSPS